MKEETAHEPVEMTTDRIRTIFSDTNEIVEVAIETILEQQTAKYGPNAILAILMAVKENCQQYVNAFDFVIRGESPPEEEPETTPDEISDDPIVLVETLTAEEASGLSFPEGSPYEWVVACFRDLSGKNFRGKNVYLPWDLVHVMDDPAYPDGVRIVPAVQLFELLSDFYFSAKFKEVQQQIHGSERKIIPTFFQGKEYNFVIGHGEPLPDDLTFTDFVFIGTGKESEAT